MQNTVLEKAYSLYRKKQYAQTINVLESQVFKFRGNDTYYQLLGISCAQVSDYSGAISYLRRAIDLNPRSVRSLLAIAVVHTLQSEEQKALEYWIRVQELEPQSRLAKMGIEHIRRPFLSRSKLISYLPKVPRPRFPLLRVSIVVAICLLLAALIFGAVRLFAPRTPSRAQESLLELPELLLEEGGGSSEITLTEEEIARRIEGMRRDFLAHHDNAFRREANLLLRSNASEGILRNIRTILAGLPEMNFENLAESVSYAELADEAILYNATYVRWKGKIANLARSDLSIDFELLVGYHESQLLEGIVAVSVPFSTLLEDGDSVEVVGQIDTTTYPYRVVATGIRPLASAR